MASSPSGAALSFILGDRKRTVLMTRNMGSMYVMTSPQHLRGRVLRYKVTLLCRTYDSGTSVPLEARREDSQLDFYLSRIGRSTAGGGGAPSPLAKHSYRYPS